MIQAPRSSTTIRLLPHQPRTRWPSIAASLLGLACALAACSGVGRVDDHPFWLRSPGEVRARLEFHGAESGIAVSIPGVIARADAAGRVVDLTPSALAGFLHRLELERDDGTRVSLHYRLGDSERLPIVVGENVRLRVYRRRHADDDGEDSGMLVWQRLASDARTLDGTASRLERLVVLAESRSVIEGTELPEALRAIAVTDAAVYHETGVTKADCEETIAHCWFRLGRASSIETVIGRGNDLDPRQVAPGSKVFVRSGGQRYQVLMVENRQTVNSACRVASEPSWSWVATLQDQAPVGGERGTPPVVGVRPSTAPGPKASSDGAPTPTPITPR